jgi:hypothetical protein
MSLPQETVDYLKAWMMPPKHISHPYPREQEKAEIMAETGIEPKQLTNWFVNNRKRYWKPRVEAKLATSRLPQETVDYLKAWMMSPEHISHPYPTEQEKAEIMAETGIELKQLTNWFYNNRKSYWKPRMEQMNYYTTNAFMFMMPPPRPLQHPSLNISAVKRRVGVDSSSQYQYQVGFHVVAIKKLRREITQKDQEITQLMQAKEAAIRRAEAAEKDAKEALLKLECSLCLEINEVQYVMCPCGHVICTDCNVRYSTYANCLTCSTFVENRIKLHK